MLGSGLARALPLELAAGAGAGRRHAAPRSWGHRHQPETCKDCSGRSHGTQQLSPVSSRHPALLCFLQENAVLLSPGLSDSTKNARSSALFELVSSSLHLAIGKFIYVPFLLIDYIY